MFADNIIKSENPDDLFDRTLSMLSTNQTRLNVGIRKRLKNCIARHELLYKQYAEFETCIDSTQENLDKIRVERLTTKKKCEILEKEFKKAEFEYQSSLARYSQVDNELRKQLSSLRAELHVYESILQVGIEELPAGKRQGVIFKSDSCVHCEIVDNDKENLRNSREQYARLNKLYSQLEVSEPWKQFMEQ